jgi:hypothetical protein
MQNQIETVDCLIVSEDGSAKVAKLPYEISSDYDLTIFAGNGQPYTLKCKRLAEIAGYGENDGPAAVFGSEEVKWEILVPWNFAILHNLWR